MTAWQVLGWIGNACFFSRFFIQWVASERARRSVAPAVFWWISLAGSVVLAAYTVHDGRPILLVGFSINGLIYTRNLWVHYRRGPATAPPALQRLLPLGVLAVSALVYSATRAEPQGRGGWLVLGVVGQSIWSSRFVVQWLATEQTGKSRFPAAFWWLSLAGNACMLAYTAHLGNPILIAGFLPGPVVQIRNLVLEYRRRSESGSTASGQAFGGAARHPGLWLALALCAVSAVPGNGAARPLEEHEVFVARSAEEMMRAGELVVGRFNGEPRLAKPPLETWLVMAAHGLLGGDANGRVTELEARLPAVLAALALTAVVYLIAMLVFDDRRAAAVSAVLWATSVGCASYAHNARPEMTYALFCGLALAGFLLAQRSGERRGARLAAGLLAWGGVAGAVLTKGPFLPTFLCLGVAWVCLRRRELSLRRDFQPLLGLVVLLVVVGAYVAATLARLPDALDVWRHEMFDRVSKSERPFWLNPLDLFYLYAPLPLLAPWIFPVVLAVPFAWRERSRGAAMLVAPILTTLFFMSFSEGRRGYYLLPVLPLACCLMGAATARFLERPQAFARAVGVHAMAFAAFAVALGVGTFTVPRLGERAAVGLLGAALVLALCAVAWNARRRAPLRAGATAVAALALLLGSGASTGAGWREPRYVKAAFARRVGALVGAQTPIVSFAGDQELFVYYTDRPIPRLSLKEPDALEALGPETLVLCTRSRLESGALRGTTVLSEEPLPDRDPLLLVAPERSQTPGAFADEQAPGTAAAPAR